MRGVEHRLSLQRRRRHRGLLREGAVLGLGARDAAGVSHRQHLGRALAGRLRGRRVPLCPLQAVGARTGLLCWARGAWAGLGARLLVPACFPPLPTCSSRSVPTNPVPRFCCQKEDSIIVGTSTGATYQFQLLPLKMGSLEKRWVRTKPFQHHTHDVRAVAHSSTALISGGTTSRQHRQRLGLSTRRRSG